MNGWILSLIWVKLKDHYFDSQHEIETSPYIIVFRSYVSMHAWLGALLDPRFLSIMVHIFMQDLEASDEK